VPPVGSPSFAVCVSRDLRRESYPTSDTQREVRTVGGTIFVPKPFANTDMLDAVRRALNTETPPDAATGS
jgi:hypothetical protein